MNYGCVECQLYTELVMIILIDDENMTGMVAEKIKIKL